VTASSVSNTTGPKTVTVTCPSGKILLGGGARISASSDNNLALAASYPSGATTWTAVGVETDSVGSNWAIVAYGICALVQP
jgi:hypothetical protein